MTKFDDFTEYELIEYPLKRVQHLEYLLSYFFGETKLSVINDACSIEFAQIKLPENDFIRVYFSKSEIETVSIVQYFDRMWKLIYWVDQRIKNESKESR